MSEIPERDKVEIPYLETLIQLDIDNDLDDENVSDFQPVITFESGNITTPEVTPDIKNSLLRAFTQKTLAMIVLAIISLMSTVILFSVINKYLKIEEAKELSILLVSPFFAIFGTMVGYFFGSEQK